MKCGKAVSELESTGLHDSEGGLPSGEGFVAAQATCHGEKCNIFVPFDRIEDDLIVEVFTDPPQAVYAPFGWPDLYEPGEFKDGKFKLGRPLMQNGVPCALPSSPGSPSLPHSTGTEHRQTPQLSNMKSCDPPREPRSSR